MLSGGVVQVPFGSLSGCAEIPREADMMKGVGDVGKVLVIEIW